MAVISIPTSIAGVSIPGFSLNAPNGPLSALYTNNFGTNILQYPRDLNTSAKGHLVQFTIYDVRPANITEFAGQIDNKINKISNAVASAKASAKAAINNPGAVVASAASSLGSAASSLGDTVSNIPSALSDAYTSVTNFSVKDSLTSLENNLSTIDLNFQPPADIFNTSISLYMPETVNFSYEAKYNSDSTVVGAASAVLPLIGTIAGFLQNNEAAKAALYEGGFVFNPQHQVMFEGIEFRSYQMDFVFTPYSAQEAATVNSIIKAFRRAASPTKIKQAAGLFFNPPSVVDVDFQFNGQTNTNLNKLKRSVLKSVNVDYAPNGWSAYTDGQPVQTKMTLEFMELELVTRADIESGF